MSSDEASSDEGRMAFTADTDYEGGQWVGGEFYFSSEKRRRAPHTKDEVLYGVFHESGDEADGGRKRRRRGGVDGGGGGLKPISFVGGACHQPSARADFEHPNEAPDEGESPAPGPMSNDAFRQLMQAGGGGWARGSEAEPTSLAKPSRAAAVEGPLHGSGAEEHTEAKDASVDRKMLESLGTWEKHTKGFGLKMLLGMGYKGGGLGKGGKGISRHVEVAVRPSKAGLGTVKEVTSSRANRKIEAELTGKKLEEPEEEDTDGGSGRRKRSRLRPGVAEQAAGEGRWRRGAGTASSARRVGKKPRFLTANDVLAEQRRSDEGNVDSPGDARSEQHGPAPVVLLDLRGPEARVLSSLDDLAADGQAAAAPPPLLGQELLANLDLLVDLARGRIEEGERDRHQNSELAAQLRADTAAVQTRVDAGRTQLSRFKRVAATLGSLSEDGRSPRELFDAFRELQSGQLHQEFDMFGMAQLATPLVVPVLEERMANWSPLDDPGRAAELVAHCTSLVSSASASASAAPFEALVEQTLVRKVVACLTNQWDVNDAAPALCLVAWLRGTDTSEEAPLAAARDGVALPVSRTPLLSAAAMDGLLRGVVFPKLKHAVERWQVGGTLPCEQHGTWFCPWLAHIRDELAGTLPVIRRKLLQSLEREVDGAVQCAVLESWLPALDAKSLDGVAASVAGQLALKLRRVEVDPSNQQLGVLDEVLAWSRVLPQRHMLCLLSGEFFPRWCAILFEWVRTTGPSANGDLVRWYQGWKTFVLDRVPPDAALLGHFSHVLDLMQRGRTLPADQFTACNPTGAVAVLNYAACWQARRAEPTAPAPTPAPAPGKATPPVAGSLHSMKEVVADFAQQHGTPFVLKHGRFHDGKQIYTFGHQGRSIFIDQDVIHVELSKSQWAAVGLDDLLAMTGK